MTIISKALGLLVLALAPLLVTASKTLSLEEDRRAVIPLLNMGMATGANLVLKFDNIHIIPEPTKFVGVFMLKGDQMDIGLVESDDCPVDWHFLKNRTDLVDFRNVTEGSSYTHTVADFEAGYWSAFLVNCDQWSSLDPSMMTGPALSIDLLHTAINPPNSLLSAGMLFSPRIYLFSFVAYSLLMAAYSRMLRNTDAQVYTLHKLMLASIGMIIIDKAFHGIQAYYLSTGYEAKGWAVAMYASTFIKSTVLMSIFALIASGWSFVRPILPEGERKMVLWVIPIQVLSNLARVMVDAMEIGSSNWDTWDLVFIFLDFVSFVIILTAIMRTHKHLQLSLETDGKAAATLRKVRMWGALYTGTIVYMYATRVVIQIVSAGLPYTHEWVSLAMSEVASVVFYSFIGWRFRPVAANPYMELEFGEDDEEPKDEEEAAGVTPARFELGDDDMEMEDRHRS
ncbi:lung seven transmembrane receptor-domain-containing protein [Blastocladiella britannica]|nr:lung seven transmembrane receptor-domain-containing protein [Blastocladiella britannica]